MIRPSARALPPTRARVLAGFTETHAADAAAAAWSRLLARKAARAAV
ncbi:MAG: hypothetical protein NVV62_05130 [Terricaulis sp.]|nr:hypothetical protein [Terricaulis sp.]